MPRRTSDDHVFDRNSRCGLQRTREPDDADHALARAKLARFIAEIMTEPDDDWSARLGAPEILNELRDAMVLLQLEVKLLDTLVSRLGSASQIAEERDELFGHTVRSSCPPYELEYKASQVFQQSQSLADIAGFYRAFGVEHSGPLGERPDHFVSQWEFLSLLSVKEYTAITESNIDAAVCCRDAARSFLRDHAATWMFAWFNRVRQQRRDGLFAAAADLADGVLRQWCEARGVSIGPSWLELRPVDEDDSTITCGPTTGGQVELGPRLAQAMEGSGRGC